MKTRCRAALLALLLALACLPGRAEGLPAAEALPPLIRLRVIAASDSAADQAEKLLARDAVLAETRELLAGCEDYAQAYRVLDERLADVEAAARESLPGRGVRAELTRERCPHRLYGRLLLPAGEYTSLKVVIGAGEGHNWWCVVYPSLCAPAPEEPSPAPAAQAQAPETRTATAGGGFWGWLWTIFVGERDAHA